MSTAVQKASAAFVIAVCLGAQLYAAARPSGARLWPFMDYPMYSRSHVPGATIRVRQLRAVSCENAPHTWKVEGHTLGYQSSRYASELRGAVADRPAARRYRADLTRLVLMRVTPRPCALQVWERVVTVTHDGLDASSLRDVRWDAVQQWRVNDPDAAQSFIH